MRTPGRQDLRFLSVLALAVAGLMCTPVSVALMGYLGPLVLPGAHFTVADQGQEVYLFAGLLGAAAFLGIFTFFYSMKHKDSDDRFYHILWFGAANFLLSIVSALWLATLAG